MHFIGHSKVRVSFSCGPNEPINRPSGLRYAFLRRSHRKRRDRSLGGIGKEGLVGDTKLGLADRFGAKIYEDGGFLGFDSRLTREVVGRWRFILRMSRWVRVCRKPLTTECLVRNPPDLNHSSFSFSCYSSEGERGSLSLFLVPYFFFPCAVGSFCARRC